MTVDEIYDRCLEAHALNWIENYRVMDRAVYLEMRGGPLISKFIEYYGLTQVVEDFIAKTVSEN